MCIDLKKFLKVSFNWHTSSQKDAGVLFVYYKLVNFMSGKFRTIDSFGLCRFKYAFYKQIMQFDILILLNVLNVL